MTDLEYRLWKHVAKVHKDGTIPTVRDCARSLRVRHEALLDAAENLEADGDLMIGVALGCNGGMYTFDKIGDYLLEPLYRRSRSPGIRSGTRDTDPKASSTGENGRSQKESDGIGDVDGGGVV